MTLEELARTLPNGFHDAEFRTVLLDYGRRRVLIDVSVWIGDMDAKFAPREGYRDGELVIDGLHFVVIEPPDPRYPFAENTSLCVAGCSPPSKSDFASVSALPAGCFASRFFVNEWNSFIHVAARGANLTWKGAAYDRG